MLTKTDNAEVIQPDEQLSDDYTKKVIGEDTLKEVCQNYSPKAPRSYQNRSVLIFTY